MIVTNLDLSMYPRCLYPGDSPTGPRSPGVHLTDILRDMAKVANMGEDKSGFLQEELEWFAGPGFLWERIWDQAHAEQMADGTIVSPGEFYRDGIHATPDRIDWSVPKVIELKVRWKSSRKFESLERNFWVEIAQLKSYCAMTGIMEGDLVVFFIAGHWQPPVPEVKGVHLTFTELELEETWQQVLSHAKWRGWL